MKNITLFGFALLYLLSPGGLLAGELTNPDSVLFELEPITVSAFRFSESSSRIPFSLSRIDRPAIQLARQQLSLREVTAAVPGLFSLNTYNFAQDLRLSVRGFGARGAFGIRGIKFLIDGIPITTPDGQTSVDNLDLSLIDHLEIIRGPVSALYGNASGGVIDLTTVNPSDDPFIQTRFSTGAYGFRQWQIQAGQRVGNVRLSLSALQANLSGYRQHSAMESLLLHSSIGIMPDSSSAVTFHLNVENSPLADDPGSLTAEQATTDPRRAAPANLTFESGESVRQGRAAFSYRHDFPAGQSYRLYAAYSARDFSNRLPFSDGGLVRLKRHYIRAGIFFEDSSRLFDINGFGQVGLEIASQDDHRKRYNNREGKEGALVYNQKELYRSIGIYLQEKLDLTPRWRLQAGLRYDLSEAAAKDYFNPGKLQTVGRTFRGFSGLIGLSWQIDQAAVLYANISSGFETPALIELTNNPNGSTGLNQDLQAQQLLNLESGVKGRLFTRFRYELAVFQINVNEGLVPYEMPGLPDRTFYHNAGRSIHRGIEAALQGSFFPGIYLNIAYTLSDFYYVSFSTDGSIYDGNLIPGIPVHHFYTELFYAHRSGLYTRIELQATGKIYTNDANSSLQPAGWQSNLQAGWQKRLANWALEPFIGFNNLFSRTYADNIRINAYGGRYFEPAPPLNLFAGLSVKYSFQNKR